MEIQVSPETVDVESSTVVLVDQTLDAEVVYSEPLIQVHSGNNYVLSSGCEYASNGLIGQIPQWLLDAVEQKLSTGDGNIVSIVNDMRALLDSLSIGVDQIVSEFNTLSLSQNSLMTSVSSQLQEDKAQIMNILASKVDSDGATALVAQAINSTFGGDVDAYIGSIAATYTNDNSAIAQNVEVLRSTLGDVSASITTLDSVVVERVSALENSVSDLVDSVISDLQAQIDGQISSWFYAGVPTSTNAPENTWADTEKASHLGDLYYDTDTGYAYRYALQGTSYVWIKITDLDVVKALEDASRAQSTADGKSTVYYSDTDPKLNLSNIVDVGDVWVNSSNNNETKTWNGTTWVGNETKWSAESSKFITAPDGSITGWKFADGSNQQSTFNVYAENFSISDGTSSYSPFSVIDGVVYVGGIDTSTPTITYLGQFDTAPTATSISQTYKNTIDGNTYIWNGTSWDVLFQARAKLYGIAFARSASMPEVPTGGSFEDPTPVGWSDGVPAEDGNPCWVSGRLFTNDGIGQDAAWSTPTIFTSTSDTKYVYSTSTSMPALSGSWLTNKTPSGWTSTLSTSVIWAAISTMSNGVWSDWSGYRIKGEQGPVGATGATGATGPAGVQGMRSAGVFSGPAPSAGWSNSAASSIVTNVTGTSPINFDKVTLYYPSTNPTWSETMYYSGGSWLTAQLYVNGNAMVRGTLTADTIVANHIGTAKLDQAWASWGAGGVAVATFGSAPTYGTSTSVASYVVYNYSNRTQKVCMMLLGRTGVLGPPVGGSTCISLFKGTTYFTDGGWTPIDQDAKASAAYDTIPANSSITYTVRVSVNNNTFSSFSVAINIVSVGLAT